jgi:hypothetical protein
MYDRRTEESGFHSRREKIFIFTTGSKSTVCVCVCVCVGGGGGNPENSQNTAVTVHNTRFNTNSFIFCPATVLGFLHDSRNEQLNWFIL